MRRPRSIIATGQGPLPAEGVDSFVGRDAELERLGQLLRGDTRLVTILGLPGVGKTRLALELGRRAISTAVSDSDVTAGFREVWFVDLTAATTSADVLAVIGGLLQIPIDSAEVATTKIGAALAERAPALLILDNLEQLVPVVAGLLTEWLARAPDVRWLATSQHRLRVVGEQVLELAPLALPESDQTMEALSQIESVQLFLQRAQSVGADLSMQADNAEVLIEVLKLLDGLPLAIEMAAARMNLLDLRELRRRLEQRFLLLQGRFEERDERHSSLRTAIEWSWELLQPWERSALAQCSVFRGGFDLAAAEAVVSVDAESSPPVLEIIQSLRDRSLIQRALVDQSTRLTMCLSIREFADEALSRMGTEAAAARRRHAEHYAGVCHKARERLETANAVAEIRRLTRERDNLLAVIARTSEYSTENDVATALAALEIAAAVEATSSLDGSAEQAEAVLAVALEVAESVGVGPNRTWRCRVARARSLTRLGQLDQASSELQTLRSGLWPSVDDDVVAALELEHGFVCIYRGKFEEGLSRCRRALDSGQARQEALVRARCSSILAQLNRMDEAVEEADRALALLRGGSPIDETGVLINIALSQLHLGQLEQARVHSLRALDIAERSGLVGAEGYALYALTVAAADVRRHEEAERFGDRAVNALLRIGERDMAAFCLVHLAEVARCQGDVLKADDTLRRARTLARRDDRRFRAAASTFLARRAWEEQRYEAARDALQNALDVGGADSPNWSHYYLSQLGAVACLLNDDEARTLFDKAKQIRLEADPAHFGLAARLYQSFPLTREGRDATETQTRLDQLATVLSEALARRGETGRTGTGSAVVDRSALVRVAAQHLLLAVPPSHRARLEARARDPEHLAVVIEAEGRWLRLPGKKEVDLSRRPLLARLISILLSARFDQGGRSVAADELVDRLWPGESLLYESALDRVYSNVRQLRKLGLGELLVSDDRGYRLDDRATIMRIPEIG